MTAKSLMFQGTGSDVGKSLVVAGLCRALVRRGMAVRPFKPQNMSNNAAVTPDGGEIGRAQALQAKACGVPTSTAMNPVLLKPQSDIGAQLVVNGKVVGNFKARDYQSKKPELLAAVLENFKDLKNEADFILVEGAGSAAEVNLRDGDIANMGFATASRTPVVLIADIDRGGLIASVVGTWALLPEEEQQLVAGYVINKFRGDVSLFDDGIKIIAQETGLKCFGVIPYLAAARQLPQEDAMSLEHRMRDGEGGNGNGSIRIAVPKLAHISNYDDFDPLAAEPDVDLQYIPPGTALPGDADLVILPGSKTTIADLADFRQQGWDIDLRAHVRRGGLVLGLCAGYQMLGRVIWDLEQIEGDTVLAEGLGLLDVETVLAGDKTLTEVAGKAEGLGAISGYEMHIGDTTATGDNGHYLTIDGLSLGSMSEDGKIMGCYLHGLFAADEFRASFLGKIADRNGGLAYDIQVEQSLDAIAASLEEVLDVDGIIVAAN